MSIIAAAKGPEPEALRCARALRWALLATAIVACGLWLAFLAFQTGHVWDESEHAHVAWLMSQGQRPIDDFFQHHQPLLWDLLSIYYRAGFDGAGVLAWGRVLVVLCGLVCIWAFLVLGRNPKREVEKITIAGFAATAAFAATTVFLQALFVSRPETLSTALILAALVLWVRDDAANRPLKLIAAGVLAGAACYASPRFVLCGGFFLVLGVQTYRNWALLVAGGLIFVFAYTLLSGFPIRYVVFNLEFSSYLQTVGDYAAGPTPGFWTFFALATILPLLPLVPVLAPEDRIRGLLLVSNLLLVFLACHHFAGMFRYQQAYAPFAAGIPVTLAFLLGRFRVTERMGLAMLVIAVLLTVVSVSLLRVSQPPLQFTIAQEIREKNALADMLPAGRAVLLFTRKHPIAVPDASYYGSPLFDARDRLCRAVEGFTGATLPKCNFLHDVRVARPYMVDTWIDRAVNPADLPTLQKLLDEGYSAMPLNVVVLPALREGILIDKLPQ